MAKKVIKTLRDFPSVEELLQTKELSGLAECPPRPLLSEIVRELVREAKADFKSNRETEITIEQLVQRIHAAARNRKLTDVRKVINASGIIIHTNLGRAPLGEHLLEGIREAVGGYSNLELDLKSGKRGGRSAGCENYLSLLTGAESAAVVNNCAAALFIILNTFARRQKVILSRGELVQIGGGFRIPDILKRSGGKLAEVGTTNITKLSDYANAIDDSTALILKVHKSNFVQSGFAEEVHLKKLAALAHQKSLLLVNDLGSGALFSTKKILGYDEPTARQSVRDGADLTCFSGDKMLGSVQSGLIVGKKELIGKIKNNPLFRTVRVDKIVIAILENVLKSYLNGTQLSDVKLWQMLSVPESELYSRGKNVLEQLNSPRGISVQAVKAYLGGGGLPEAELPSVGLVFSPDFKATTLLKKLRDLTPPVIGRIENECVILDLKAVDKTELQTLVSSIKESLN